MAVEPKDIIQIRDGRWDDILCVVDEVREWGVVCYATLFDTRGNIAQAPYRVQHGDYALVGRVTDSSAVVR